MKKKTIRTDDNFMRNFIYTIGAISISFIIVLAACSPSSSPGPALISECKFNEPIRLTVVEYDSTAELIKEWERVSKKKFPKDTILHGFATYNKTADLHTLHIMRIRGQNDSNRIETLGHELLHSFCGDWHPPYAGH